MPESTAPALDWDEVRLFLAVAREGSLASAGARLGVDVSTVSRRLSRLEALVGAQLFDRTREGTTPTALAEELVAQAEEMERAAAGFASARSQVETEVEGVVRLTAPPGICDYFIAPALAELVARHPRLRLDLDASTSYADLTRHEADLALRTSLPTSGDLVAVKATAAPSIPLASPALARRLGKLERLEDAPWINWGAAFSYLPDAVWLRTHGPTVVPVLRTDHMQSQIAAARSGLGVLVAPAAYAGPDLVPIAHHRALDAAWKALPSTSLWLVGHRALRKVPRIAAVWSFILERLAPPPAGRSSPGA